MILSITTLPPIAIAAPLFNLRTEVGPYNTWAGLIVNTTPLVALVIIFQKRIVAGLTAGAVKG